MKLATGGDYPNTDTYQNGIVKPTGVSIEVLSDSGLIMLFKVTGIGTRMSGIPNTGKDGSSTEGPIQSKTTTAGVLSWILSLLAGIGMMVGVVVLVL
jgi:hypothetical protein